MATSHGSFQLLVGQRCTGAGSGHREAFGEPIFVSTTNIVETGVEVKRANRYVGHRVETILYAEAFPHRLA